MKTIKIKIDGMSCKNCSDKIDQTLKKTNGIIEAKTFLADDFVKVTFHPNQINEKQIKEKISNLGYGIIGEINPKKSETKRTIIQGIIYGLIPHIGCIGFLLASVLGITFAAELFKPLLANPLFFYGLIILSILLATISSIIYLKKNELLSIKGIKKKKGYLITMYATTIGVSLIFLFIIFPQLASTSFETQNNITNAQLGSQINDLTPNILETQNEITLKVQIPCAGHTFLIVSELKKMTGINSISSPQWDTFIVTFDPTKTTPEKILNADIFRDYSAKIV
jgi:copper chaperone CopZ